MICSFNKSLVFTLCGGPGASGEPRRGVLRLRRKCLVFLCFFFFPPKISQGPFLKKREITHSGRLQRELTG